MYYQHTSPLRWPMCGFERTTLQLYQSNLDIRFEAYFETAKAFDTKIPGPYDSANSHWHAT